MPSAPELLQDWRSSKSARDQFERHWQDLAERLLPKRADFTVSRAPGARRTQRILDSTPLQARFEMARAVHGMLFPLNQRWARTKTVDDQLMDRDDVAEWCEEVDRDMWRAIYDPQAKFLEATGETADDVITFGTAGLFVHTNQAGNRLAFRSDHLRDLCLAENEDGLIDTCYLERLLTGRQAVRLYGVHSRKLQDALDRNTLAETECRYLHVIRPRFDADPRRVDNLAMPWAHWVVDIEDQKQVFEGGFQEFPYAIPRWETSTNEIYGRSPGMIALPDVMTLNEQRFTTLRAGQMATDPPIAMPTETSFGEGSFLPGGFVYYDPTSLQGLGGARNAIYPINTGANLPLGLEMENQTREMIWAAFWRHIMRLPVGGPEMTATEILARREEFLQVVAPVFGRLELDLPGMIVPRVFSIMLRAGALPPLPDVLRGRRVTFEYDSIMQAAFERIEAAAAEATLNSVAPMLEMNPAILDNFDQDGIVRHMARANRMPRRFLRSEEDVQQIRADRQRQEAAAQALEEGDTIARAAGRATPAIKALTEAGGGGSRQPAREMVDEAAAGQAA